MGLARQLVCTATTLLATASIPVLAQQSGGSQAPRSAVGQAGQRQTREDAATGVKPMDRLSNRIQNRIDLRLRTRIDPAAREQPTDLSPFVRATEQAQAASAPR
jgi:hypothetical protein